ncbi:MAG: hypothetical protein KZQ93_01230 [Candidatus Thiodiazotropha sp. (ex Monitilora ramsayi)]|nr:hypothetical protein [Candidatus Thiodiazotropha sp. (ex Monitilora ramsayi)]
MGKHDPKSFEYCECERTQELAAIEESPVKYDPDTKEFSVEYEGLDGTTKYIIVFCAFCGGHLPARAVEAPYESLTEEEVNDLKSIIKDCSSITEVLAKNGNPEIIQNSLIYKNLSNKAWVQVVEMPDKPLSAIIIKNRRSIRHKNT